MGVSSATAWGVLQAQCWGRCDYQVGWQAARARCDQSKKVSSPQQENPLCGMLGGLLRCGGAKQGWQAACARSLVCRANEHMSKVNE